MSELTRAKLPKWMQDHLKAYLETNGETGHLYDASAMGGPKAVPSLILTTKGRKSGQDLMLPLFYGETDDGKPVVVASKGGAPEHPAWYLNLEANPEVQVQIKADKYRARARTTSGAERAKLWEKMNIIWPPYESYQKKTAREIPVVVLERL
ncbi:MAG TPA: nitroreductase family deazaflavin-dependent oxidoreductase [Nevskiaceae bacterium]|nr:nitroreductase family deazaflavin-dependent oxidoreductase [Nevskiaceae bacterium]